MTMQMNRTERRETATASEESASRLVGALLAVAVAAIHVADQGGVAALAVPDWIGWSYRLIEIGALITALLLLLPWTARLGWFAGILLGLGPFLGYVVSRTVGLPGDAADVGNWGYWVGTVSLLIEAALVTQCVAAWHVRSRQQPQRGAERVRRAG